ncbi:MAG: NAD-specific glutamate dehydrogenase [Methanomethylovorans sp. PtaU1.Bin093]|nr:MAG: NAD-specific glutamate dehydrogenase [Methanomethylovorans sp. PtaU1.Bin093]
MSISAGRKYLKYPSSKLQDGYIKGTASEVVDKDLVIFSFFIKTIGKGCRSRFIDDPHYFQTCNGTCVFSSLSLCIIEISGNCDDSLCDGLSQICLGIFLHFTQDHGRYFLRSIILSAEGYLIPGLPHVPFYGIDSIICICDHLPLGNLSHKFLTLLGKAYYRRCCPASFCIRDDGWLSTFDNSHTGICSSKVNTQYLCHIITSQVLIR